MPHQSQQLIVVANRAPHQPCHDARSQLRLIKSASGVVNAVAPMLSAARDAVWVAEGAPLSPGIPGYSASIDVHDGALRYRLRRVLLDSLERCGYYEGFANSGLWPLCHRTPVQPIFRAVDFQAYERVNRRFADAVGDEALYVSPDVLIQDYHFGLAPHWIRKQLPLSAIAMFWHIPWPRPERLQLCPWSRCLLEGLLGSDLIGFQTGQDRHNFLECVERHGRAAAIDHGDGVIDYRGRRVRTGVYPASIEWPGQWASVGAVPACRQEVRRALGLSDDALLAVGVDRLDYTKGLEQKFLAVEQLLERDPSLIGRFVLVQIAEPTRVRVAAYQDFRVRLFQLVERINARFGTAGWDPIRLFEQRHEPADVARYFRAADVCYVASLHDGMNLVSKEFVAARDDLRGVLVLSAFAGAAAELTSAVQVNPHDIDQSAAALAYALAMSPLEQCRRMREMRTVVASAAASCWGTRILDDLHGGPAPSMRSVASRSVLAARSPSSCDHVDAATAAT